jgi:glycosyltransferase involved in cell wall biosynthesis/predicted Zn-dependent protease
MRRILTLEIPEHLYRALEGIAAREGRSPEAVGTTWLIDAIARRANQAAPPRDGLGIVWEGPLLDLHSLSQVNRELCLRLIERGHELALVPSKTRDAASRPFSGQQTLEGHFHRVLRRPIAAHVRHEWPPSFTPPPEGHWVIIQPWEFGSVPRSWVDPMSTLVDEVWAYSRFVRNCYIAGGVPAERVHVVPLGIDPHRFHPGAKPFPLKTTKPFRFLFVGGTIHRKGIDVLLKAYAETFAANDPVCLVIKDMGGASFYRGQTAGERINQLRADAGSAEIEYLDQELSDGELAGLYTACHCLVHPYRGEGFCLPIAEAMACGLPVMVTGYGAALDFCTEENAFLIPARIVRFREQRIGDLDTVDYPWLAEPDLAALRHMLRLVFDRPGEARMKGRAAFAHVRSHLTWDHAVDVIEARLAEIRQRPIRRFDRPPSSDARRRPNPQPISARPTAIETGPTARQRVSLCMIVKDEEASLATCLGSVADLVDEIVVVDTGSTDATAAVAARWGARVFPFRWVDSFAAARNESLRHARGDWIFWLDADESLDQDNRLKLRAVLEGLKDENAAYVMTQRSPSGPGTAAVVVDQVRLFRRLPDALWSYRVHEQILSALRRTGVDLRRSDVVIHHAGHEDAALRRRRLDRDLRLLLLENQERPDDPFTLFNLGALYDEIDRPAEALPLLERSLQRSRPRDSIVPKLHVLIARCHRRLRQSREALDACRSGQKQCPGDVELLFLEALLQRELGDAKGAEATWLRLLSGSEPAGFANVDDGLRGYKARHNLAVIYEETGRAAEAEAQWRAAVAENPSFAPGWLRLGDLYLKQCRWDDLEAAAKGVANCPGGDVKADAMRARGLEARRRLTCVPSATVDTPAVTTILCVGERNVPPAARPRVSLCMIVKDEEANLAECLASVAGVVDEMIVVDTGSRDQTREVAARNGARVVDFAWVDDFAAARNESITHATADWIFWLDADERLDLANREKLRNLFTGLSWENAAYLMQQLSTTEDPHGSRVAVDQVRLFRRDPALRWEYRVHEQIMLAIRRAGHDVRRTDIVITHGGYEAPGAAERKLQRNVELLLRQDAERPDDPITLYHLGLANQRLGRAAEALPLLRRSLELLPPDYSIRPRLFVSIARAHEILGQRSEALAVCRKGRGEFADSGDLLFLEATLLLEQGELAEAEERLQHLLQVPSVGQLAAGDAGRHGYKARHILAEVYRRQRRWADAETHWRLVVAEQPRFVPAWRELGELYLTQGRWPELEELAGSLAQVNQLEASHLRARAHEARTVLATARPVLDRTAQSPS